MIVFAQAHGVLLQFIDVVHTHLESTAYSATIPPLEDLLGRFGLEPGVAFHIARRQLNEALAVHLKVRLCGFASRFSGGCSNHFWGVNTGSRR